MTELGSIGPPQGPPLNTPRPFLDPLLDVLPMTNIIDAREGSVHPPLRDASCMRCDVVHCYMHIATFTHAEVA